MVGAKGLRDADWTGGSDPYCVSWQGRGGVCLKYTGRRWVSELRNLGAVCSPLRERTSLSRCFHVVPICSSAMTQQDVKERSHRC